MRIAIDFDGTIANTNSLHHDYCKEHFGIELPIEATVSPLREAFLTAEQIKELRRYIHREATLLAPLVPGARAAVQQLADAGNQIIILTARPAKGVLFAKKYLALNKIPFNQFIFIEESKKRTLSDGTLLTKKLVIERLNIDVMIEDQVKGVSGSGGRITAILLNQPWNRNEKISEGIIRMGSWDAIARLLLSQAAV